MLLLRFQGGCKGNPAKSKGGAELRAQSRRGVQTYPRKEKGGCKVGGAKHRGGAKVLLQRRGGGAKLGAQRQRGITEIVMITKVKKPL